MTLLIHKQNILLATVAIAVTTVTLSAYSKFIAPHFHYHFTWHTEFIAVCLQVPFQWLFLRNISLHRKINYALLILSVSMAGSVLLWPLLLAYCFFTITLPVAILYFLMVVIIMFIIHWQKVKKANLPPLLCYTWILYRLLFLTAMIILR